MSLRCQARFRCRAATRETSTAQRPSHRTGPGTKSSDLVLAVVARHASSERRQRQMRHDLREYELALMHRHPARGYPAKGSKSAARRSNRDQTRMAICLGRSSTYQRSDENVGDTTEAAHDAKRSPSRGGFKRPIQRSADRYDRGRRRLHTQPRSQHRTGFYVGLGVRKGNGERQHRFPTSRCASASAPVFSKA